MSFRTRARLAAVGMLTLAAAVAGPASLPSAEAHDGGHRHHELTVMTQNLYLGSSLDDAIKSTTLEQFLTAVATIYGTAVFTDFPTRAEAIADTIAEERPDLVGLQEVTNWIAGRSGTGPALPSYDFLEILKAALAERGLHYRVAAVSQNADIGPAPLVNPALGCDPPASLTDPPPCAVTLQDRDVILVNRDAHLKVRRSAHGSYEAQEVLTPPIGLPVSFARGWAYVNVASHGQRVRFATTHLEVEGFADTQVKQAREFLRGPARARIPVIATGDFNSAADPATTDTPTATYSLLTKRWFRDAWDVNGDDPGLTCCQNSTLTNPVSALRTRIDLVLLHGRLRATSAHLVDDQPIGSQPPFWASDHAGVVADVRLPR
jgi:endonuclease/exonuclease/phosphatase family metal-dependent hydrolase